MSLTKQSDVKNHLSLRYRTKIHLCESVSEPDAAGLSVAKPGAIQTNSPDFAADFFAEHSSSDAAAAPADPVPGSIGSQAAAVFKSERA